MSRTPRHGRLQLLTIGVAVIPATACAIAGASVAAGEPRRAARVVGDTIALLRDRSGVAPGFAVLGVAPELEVARMPVLVASPSRDASTAAPTATSPTGQKVLGVVILAVMVVGLLVLGLAALSAKTEKT